MILDWKRRLVFWSGAISVGRILAMVLPPMAAVLIAKLCSRMACPTPLFHTMAKGFIGRPGLEERSAGSHA